ncbi:MAG TPA: ring-cleaving dioxygenase [Tissierellaceae bacterium]|nr:ring-cleaving dioxygenase [Tissierellaceae bacterium]
MKKRNVGIHHITSIVGNPQKNAEFYGEVLGLRMVKKSVNFDDPRVYHLYFGDKDARPGTIITFFPYEDAGEGIVGDGQVGVTTYIIPGGAMSFWEDRLGKFNIDYKISERFNEKYLEFNDPHGLKLELVERKDGVKNHWGLDDIDSSVAIKGFGGAVFYSHFPEVTAKTVEEMLGLERIGREGDFLRFKSSGDIGNIIDVKMVSSGRGKNNIGTVHHISWRAEDEEDLLEWQELARENKFVVTDIKERNYFKSIYFRERGGILFEIATDGPGFTFDEDIDSLGEKFVLPEWHEDKRERLEKTLPPINIRRGQESK